jgi:hypothetical protein
MVGILVIFFYHGLGHRAGAKSPENPWRQVSYAEESTVARMGFGCGWAFAVSNFGSSGFLVENLALSH